jgi:hypothetical protein
MMPVNRLMRGQDCRVGRTDRIVSGAIRATFFALAALISLSSMGCAYSGQYPNANQQLQAQLVGRWEYYGSSIFGAPSAEVDAPWHYAVAAKGKELLFIRVYDRDTTYPGGELLALKGEKELEFRIALDGRRIRGALVWRGWNKKTWGYLNEDLSVIKLSSDWDGDHVMVTVLSR